MKTNSIYGNNKKEAFEILLSQGVDESVARSIADSMTFEDNDNNKEGKDMKKRNDYTLGGRVEATDWKEFIALAKTMGINTYRKNYEALAKEILDKLSDSEEILTAEDTGLPIDRVDSESIKKGDDYMKLSKREIMILTLINQRTIEAKRGLYVGQKIITKKYLFGVIKESYYDVLGNKKMNIKYLHDITNGLVRHGYLRFKKAPNGGITFFPTEKLNNVLEEIK